jgi:hypothetical protein
MAQRDLANGGIWEMTAEFAAECSDLRERLGFQKPRWSKTALAYLLLTGVFGILLPFVKGRDFLDSVILGGYASLGVVFAAPAAGSEFEQTPSTPRVLARVVISVLYGELLAGALVLLGLLTIYISRWGRIVVGPDLRSLGECALLGVSLSLALSAFAAWTSLRFSPSASRRSIRLLFLGLLAAFYLRSGWLPAIALRGAAIALLLSLVFLIILIARPVADGSREKA